MKILLDVNTPRKIRAFLNGHDVATAQERGWRTLENGDLLRAAENDGFDLMLTCDKNITYQQNMRERRIALVILSTNDWSLLRLAEKVIAEAVARVKPNSYVVVNISPET